jgi:hypothetical protein
VLYGFLVVETQLKDLVNVQIFTHLLVLVELTPFLETEKSSAHELILDISVEVLVLGIAALHGALEGLLLLPFVKAVGAEGCLA